jgi:hypothetical protein
MARQREFKGQWKNLSDFLGKLFPAWTGDRPGEDPSSGEEPGHALDRPRVEFCAGSIEKLLKLW